MICFVNGVSSDVETFADVVEAVPRGVALTVGESVTVP